MKENWNVVVPALGLADIWRAALRLQLRANFAGEGLAHAVPFGEYRQCHNYDGVSADQFPDDGAGGQGLRPWRCQKSALVVAGGHALLPGIHRSSWAPIVQAPRPGPS